MRQQDRSSRTRCELVRAAAVLFERQGYARTTLSGICARAGVSGGALHFHFPNKDALAAAIEQAASGDLCRVISAPPPRRAGALQELVDVSHLLVSRLSDDEIVRAGVRLSHDAARQGTEPFRRVWHERVRALLEEARADGSLAPGVRVVDAASAVTLATEGALTLAGEGGRRPERPSVSAFWRLMLPQLAGPAYADRMDPGGPGGATK